MRIDGKTPGAEDMIVTLNGQPMPTAMEADEENGTVTYALFNPTNGQRLLDEDRKPRTATAHGLVKIVRKDQVPATA